MVLESVIHKCFAQSACDEFRVEENVTNKETYSELSLSANVLCALAAVGLYLVFNRGYLFTIWARCVSVFYIVNNQVERETT